MNLLNYCSMIIINCDTLLLIYFHHLNLIIKRNQFNITDECITYLIILSIYQFISETIEYSIYNLSILYLNFSTITIFNLLIICHSTIVNILIIGFY